MRRKIYSDLLEWKKSPDRKPLLLQGARQTGKTYILNVFGKQEYANVAYCNFESDRHLGDFFQDGLDLDGIAGKISNYKRKEIIPGKTLLIFDEIQACPEAMTSLKYFCEGWPDIHIAASGSLLGVSVFRGDMSFPVGKVDFKTMLPLDFEEFLEAMGEEYLVERVRRCYNDNCAMEEAFHAKLLDLYRKYVFTGGMPEAVMTFQSTGLPELARDKQTGILNAYFNDMAKYNSSSQIPKVRAIFKSISVQLSRENRKFKYADLKSGGRARDYEQSASWLCESGIADRAYCISEPLVPLESRSSQSDFKFYMNDVGLCCASQLLLYDDIMHMDDCQANGLAEDFKGGLAENYVFCQLKSNGLRPYYWKSGNTAEVDFIVRMGRDIIPIEVKSGTNVRSKSLDVYASKYHPAYAIRLSARNFGFDGRVKSVPLYAAFCIGG